MYEGVVGSQDAVGFWLAVAGENGTLLGVVADALAAEGVVESLRSKLGEWESAESTGPLLDPTAWRQPYAFERSRLIRRLLVSAIAVGTAERERRAEWDGKKR